LSKWLSKVKGCHDFTNYKKIITISLLQVVVNDLRKCNAEAERRIRALEDRLRDAHRELQAKSDLSHSLLNVQVALPKTVFLDFRTGIIM